MKYISTRDIKKEGVSSAVAIKNGLAKDGGLYMPQSVPRLSLDALTDLCKLSYNERCAKILSLFLTDYSYDELLCDANNAYSIEKFGDNPTPITKLSDNVYMLELWHGPTAAFKDMALQLMPRLFVRAVQKCGENKTALILVATSGDTGKAALEGYRDIEGTKIKVFYPTDGVSSVQKMQMQSQEGKNVSVTGIYGNFDDAQNGVKEIFSSTEIKNELSKQNVFLSSANSINWGRLVPQIVYYVSAYCDLAERGEIKIGEKVDVCVPTGNFGNIFAAYIAKLMGVPYEKLVCASNKNKVLTDFLSTGTYDKNREFYKTNSPSMDILISSNLERLLYLTLGTEKCVEYMNSLAHCGKYTVSPDDLNKINESFIGYFADEQEALKTIKDTFENKNCLIDTHTAVALTCVNAYMNDYKAERKIIAVSTASPYKFASDVLLAITDKKPENDFTALNELSRLTGVQIPVPLQNIDKKEAWHTAVTDKKCMAGVTLDFAKA
jgi:threonine synthase